MIVDGYVRVSQVAGRGKEPERFHSPRAQREQIEWWARANGAILGRLFEELDESGARAERPMFLEATARVGTATDGVVVAKLDRWARSLPHALAAIERIQAAGGFIVSVQDGLDSRTESGRLVLRILFSVAEWELQRCRQSYDAARRMAIARGVYVGRAPIGYRRRSSGVLELDPASAPAIAEVFRRRARRAPLKELVAYLDEQQVASGNGYFTWDAAALRRIFLNRAYIGEAHSGEYVKAHAHPAIVDPITFHRVQNPPTLRAHGHGRRSLLRGGLLRCAGCRYAMSSRMERLDDGTLVQAYRCLGRRRAGTCPAPATIMGAHVEAHLERVLFARAPRRRLPAETKEDRTIRIKLDTAERALQTYRDSVQVLDALGPARFAEGLERRAAKIEQLRSKLAQQAVRRERPQLPPLADLERAWPEMTLEQRRDLIAQTIDCAFVTRGHIQVEDRVHVCWRGEAPLDLPSSGYGPTYQLKSFHPPAAHVEATRPTSAHLWSKKRIQRDLERFIGDGTAWPRFEAFVAAGRRALHDQVTAQGGAKAWAERLSVEPIRRRREMPPWSAERVREELSWLLAGRTAFPHQRELIAAGHTTLAKKASQYGGLRYWAQELGFSRTDRRRGRKRQWSPAMTRRVLRDFLSAREQWPTGREFKNSGYSGLYASMERYEGVRHWASEFGYDYPPPRRDRARPDSARTR